MNNRILPSKLLRWSYPHDSKEIVPFNKVELGKVYKLATLEDGNFPLDLDPTNTQDVNALYHKYGTTLFAVPIQYSCSGLHIYADVYYQTAAGTIKHIVNFLAVESLGDIFIRPRNRTFYSIKNLILALHDELVSQ